VRSKSVLYAVFCALCSLGPSQYLETTIRVGSGPWDVLWNPASNKVYTANGYDASVTIVDGSTNEVIGSVPAPGGGSSWRLCWNSGHNKVYCTSDDPDWLTVIDGTSDTLLHYVQVRGQPLYMAYNSLMDRLYISCADDRMIRAYDGGTDLLVEEVWLGTNPPLTLLWHPESNRLFCATDNPTSDDSVMVVDCSSGLVVKRHPVGALPFAMCRNKANNLVYVVSSGRISVMSAAGDTVLETIPANLGGYAIGISFVPYPNKLYVAGGKTYVVDCDRQVIVDSLSCPAKSAVCDTVHGKVYNAAEGYAFVIDARADTLLECIPAGGGEFSATAWNSTNSRVYAADDYGNNVYVIRDTATGIAESGAPRPVRMASDATLYRSGAEMQALLGSEVFDAVGRRVVSPKSGIYFVRAAQAQAQAIRKVVIQR
jgi:YVTN family beta-propeller protein